MRTQWIQGRALARACGVIAATILSAVTAPCQTRSQTRLAEDELVRSELLGMGKRGETIARARESVLEILQSENGCRQWFEEANVEVTEIFTSAHYVVEAKGPLFIYSMADERGEQWLKHPWAASTSQDGGRGSVIRLNANGPFFGEVSLLLYVNGGSFLRPGGPHRLAVGPYSGNTAEAQIATLLHELGHIVGRLPDDNDSWDGRSSQNTLEVQRHCMPEIRASARRKSIPR